MKHARRKISTKIWRPVIDKLNRKLDKACLRRDAYLERVLEVELPHLEAEVAIPNSEAAHAFVDERLDQLDRKLVSLSLRPELVDTVDDICKRKRIVRDAFFNRLLLLLAAPPAVLDRIFFVAYSDKWRRDVWSEWKSEGPFFDNVFYPLEMDVDPFWPIRTALDLYGEEEHLIDYHDKASGITAKVAHVKDYGVALPQRVYTTVMDNLAFKDADLYGLNCYMAEWQIPGHVAELKYRRELDALLDNL